MKALRYATCSSALLLALLALSACGGSSVQAVTETRAATGSGPAEIDINNLSNEAIYYIYMSPSADRYWGNDLLGAQVLPVGSAFNVSNVAPGYWDLRVVDSSGNSKEWYNQFFEPGGVYWIDVSSEGWTSAAY